MVTGRNSWDRKKKANITPIFKMGKEEDLITQNWEESLKQGSCTAIHRSLSQTEELDRKGTSCSSTRGKTSVHSGGWPAGEQIWMLPYGPVEQQLTMSNECTLMVGRQTVSWDALRRSWPTLQDTWTFLSSLLKLYLECSVQQTHEFTEWVQHRTRKMIKELSFTWVEAERLGTV